MKRIELIAITLCVLMVSSVCVGAVAAKPASTPQKGKSPIYQFDVKLGTTVAGKLKVNTTNPANPTYVFNGKGTAGTSYNLWYITSKGEQKTVGLAVADVRGNVRMGGTWANPLTDLTANPTFMLTSQGATPSNDIDGTTYLSLTSSASASTIRSDVVTFTAKLTYLVTVGLTIQQRVIYPAVNQQITLVAPDGSTKTATTDLTGQCTWTGTPPMPVGRDTYTARFDGATTYGPMGLLPLLPSQSSVTFNVKMPTTITKEHREDQESILHSYNPFNAGNYHSVFMYGYLKDADGKPIAGAPIEAYRTDTGARIWTGVTNNDGYYETGNIWLGAEGRLPLYPDSALNSFSVHFAGDDTYAGVWSN